MDLNVLKPASINPDLTIEGQSQRFIYGYPLLSEPRASLQLDNIYVPVVGSPSFTSSEIRNNVLSGYRWIHKTQSTETYGSYKLQKFLYANANGIDLINFNDDGTFSFPGIFGSLSTGILKNTTITGVISIAAPGIDYYSPGNPTTLLDDYNPINSLGNLSVGTNSLSSLVLGSNLYTNNTSIGDNSLASLILSGNNTSIGNTSLFKLTSNSNNNTSAGVAAGYNLTSGSSDNCFFGMQAGLNYTSSLFNCLFGFGSGGNVDNLQQCSFFGASSKATNSNLTNATAIGYLASVATSNSMVLGNGANIGIGESSPTYSKLCLVGGVQNVTSEDSILRCVSSSNAAKIELNNTTASTGRLYEIRSNSDGTYGIFDRTSTAYRTFIDINGYMGVGVSSSLKGRVHTVNGPQNQTNESTGICIETTNTNTAKLELRNSNTNGRLYEFQSNNNSGSGSAFFEITDRTGSASRIRILANGNIGLNNSNPSYTCDVSGPVRATKLMGNASPPTAVAGTAAGSSPTLVISGSEISGTFTVTAGIGSSGNIIATFTLASAMANSTYGVIFMPANTITAALATSIFASVSSTTQFTLNTATVLVSTSVYKWNFIIIGS